MGNLTDEELSQYSNFLKYLLPKPNLGKYTASNLLDLEFAEVILIKNSIRQGGNMLQGMSIFYKCPEVILVKFRLVEFTYAQNYLIREVETLLRREENALKSDPDPDWEAAGISVLDKYGPLNILDRLGKEFGKAPQEVELWPYRVVQALMIKRSDEAALYERYRELTKNKK